MRKLLRLMVGIVILVPLLLVFAVVLYIDPLVQAGIERGAGAALKVPVHLKNAKIHFSGAATLTGFEVANPPGYAEPRSVAFERIDARVRPPSLFQDVLDIEELTVVNPELILEFSGTKSNWSVLMDNLSEGTPKGAESPTSPANAPPKKYIIHKLRIQDAGARFRSDLIPARAATVTLPSVELENVGTAQGGVTLGQLLTVLLQSLGKSALKAGEGIVPKELLGDLDARLKAVETLPSQAIDELQKQIPDKDKVEKGVKDFLHRN